MPIDPVFEDVFGKIYGQPCWRVSPGHGSFLTLEFGEPHLEVSEPEPANPKYSAKMNRSLASRRVFIHGDWHLWIYCCDWKVTDRGKFVGKNTSPASYERAAGFLDGQKLLRVEILARPCRSVFEFDLGARLETRPYDRHSEQWMFFDRAAHKVLTLRADGFYSYHRSDQGGSEKWKPVH
jgi:hypothetical protein